MSDDDDEDDDVTDEAQELYEETDRDQINEWLDACECVLHTRNRPFTKWESDFIESLREQFGDNDGAHPLTGKQLVMLKKLFDKA